ncbi:MAG: BON domain-containing protein [Hyphomonadaceae bacterium]|nr:BON domain-containing protein [Hyphomonadaceae bacterium]
MRVPAVLLALCATSLTGGCAVGALATGVGMSTFQDRSMGRSIDDANASSTVKARLMAIDGPGYSRVDIETAEGQLLLSGSAPTAEHKALAERIAWSVRGIDQVANEIVVGRNPGMLRSSLDNFITAQVRAKIVADAAVKSVNFNIETQRGVVYLMGLARSDEELQRAAQSASMVRGVERVVSYVVVRQPAGLRAVTANTVAIDHRDAGGPPGVVPADPGPYADAGAGAPLLAQTPR